MARTTRSLVEQQARLSAIQRQLHGLPEESSKTPAPGPWISISRQTGSGGNELAARLAAALGWRVFDRQLVSSIAERTRSTEAAVQARDERPASALDDYLAHLLVPDDPGQAAIVEETAHVIAAIAREGRAVILGRGANWLLGGTGGLRLRVIAPVSQRVERLRRARDCSEAEARREVQRNDQAQRRYIRQTYGHDIDDPLGYDLVLNLGTLSFSSAAALVAAALDSRLAAAD